MTDAFCREFLNDEYAELCRKLAAALARKRPSPLLRGKPKTWACGIVRTIGWVNYLDDPSQKPHLKLLLGNDVVDLGRQWIHSLGEMAVFANSMCSTPNELWK